MTSENIFFENDHDVTSDDLRHLIIWSYLTNRNSMLRWRHQASVALESMLATGWGYSELYYYGRIRQTLENHYGLTEDESLAAVSCFPIRENLGFWQSITKDTIRERADVVYKTYTGLPGYGSATVFPSGPIVRDTQDETPENLAEAYPFPIEMEDEY